MICESFFKLLHNRVFWLSVVYNVHCQIFLITTTFVTERVKRFRQSMETHTSKHQVYIYTHTDASAVGNAPRL